jgi:DnaK suppressor protein
MKGQIRGSRSGAPRALPVEAPGKRKSKPKSTTKGSTGTTDNRKKASSPKKAAENGASPRQLNGKANGAHRANGAHPLAPASPRAANGATRKPNGARVGKKGISMEDLPDDYRPSDAEPFMSDRQRLYFRKKLITWKDEILRSTRETLQSLHEDSLHFADLADRATSESDKALELRARDRQRKLVAKIEAALERLEKGTYGYCEETGEPIGLKRLDARPIATLSLEAQERHERRERVYRDD